MDDLGFDRQMPFSASLTIPIPLGLVRSRGRVGPWNRSDPIDLPVSGDYTFSRADLNTIHGIGGTLTSAGSYSGELRRIAVTGSTSTPNFNLDLGGQPVPSTTSFEALVDASDGTTKLREGRRDARTHTPVGNRRHRQPARARTAPDRSQRRRFGRAHRGHATARAPRPAARRRRRDARRARVAAARAGAAAHAAESRRAVRAARHHVHRSRRAGESVGVQPARPGPKEGHSAAAGAQPIRRTLPPRRLRALAARFVVRSISRAASGRR